MATNPPEGIQRIVPMLAYEDAPKAIDFLCRAFGFTEKYRLHMPDDSVGHAELSMGDAVVMLATVWRDAGMAPPHELAGVHSQVQVYVDDVDAHYRHARAEGATIVAEPEDQFYGARIYRANDPEGHRWIFAQQRVELDDEALKAPR